MPKIRYFLSKIRQVFGNPLLLDSISFGGWKFCLLTPVLLSIATIVKFYESAQTLSL